MLDDGFYFVDIFGKDYTKFNAKVISLKKYSQNPIKADVLEFEADRNTIMPEYAEIILVVDNVHVFHGDIMERVDNITSWQCGCESMQHRLDNLYIPDFRYHDGPIKSILGSEPPGLGILAGNESVPSSGHLEENRFYLCRFQCQRTGMANYINIYLADRGVVKVAIYADNAGEPGTLLSAFNDGTYTNSGWKNIPMETKVELVSGTYYWLAFCSEKYYYVTTVVGYKTVAGTVRYKAATYSSFTFPSSAGTGFTAETNKQIIMYALDDYLMGALFLAQGIIPNGLWVSYSATVAKLIDGGKKSALREFPLYASTNYPSAGINDGCDGIVELTEAASLATIAADQYFRDDDDLYVFFGDGSYLPNAYLVVADKWADAKIELGTIDVGDYIPAIDISLAGQASASIDNVAERIGREVQFLPRTNGKVQLNMALPIARGTEIEPAKHYIHGTNCRIEYKDKIEPDAQAAVGMMGDKLPTVCVMDWHRTDKPCLFKIIDGNGKMEEHVRAELINSVLNNQDSYKVTTTEIDYSLRVGDYVRITREGLFSEVLRARQLEIKPQMMIIEVGKRPFNISEEFGKLWAINEEKNAQVIKAKALTDGAGTFIVLAVDVVNKLWKCYYEVTFTSDDDNSIISDTAFMTLEINGVIIPPGRIKIDGSTIKIDITKYCATSEVTDTTNTIEPHFYNIDGWTAETLSVSQKNGQSYASGDASFSPGDEDWLGCA